MAWADDAKAALDSAESLWLDIATAQAQGGGMPTGLETVPGAFYHDKVGGWPVPAGSFPNPQTTINDALTAADGYFETASDGIWLGLVANGLPSSYGLRGADFWTHAAFFADDSYNRDYESVVLPAYNAVASAIGWGGKAVGYLVYLTRTRRLKQAGFASQHFVPAVGAGTRS